MCQNAGWGGDHFQVFTHPPTQNCMMTHKPRKGWKAPISKIGLHRFRPTEISGTFAGAQCRPQSRALGSAKPSKEPGKISARVNSARTPSPEPTSPLPRPQLHLSYRPRPFTEGAPHANQLSPAEALQALRVLQQGCGMGQSQGKDTGWQLLKGLHPGRTHGPMLQPHTSPTLKTRLHHPQPLPKATLLANPKHTLHLLPYLSEA